MSKDEVTGIFYQIYSHSPWKICFRRNMEKKCNKKSGKLVKNIDRIQFPKQEGREAVSQRQLFSL